MFQKCFNIRSRDTAGALPIWLHLCHFRGHQPDTQLPEPAFLCLWIFSLTLEPAFHTLGHVRTVRKFMAPRRSLQAIGVYHWWHLSEKWYGQSSVGKELVACGGSLLGNTPSNVCLRCPVSLHHSLLGLLFITQTKPCLRASRQTQIISQSPGGTLTNHNKVNQSYAYFLGAN